MWTSHDLSSATKGDFNKGKVIRRCYYKCREGQNGQCAVALPKECLYCQCSFILDCTSSPSSSTKHQLVAFLEEVKMAGLPANIYRIGSIIFWSLCIRKHAVRKFYLFSMVILATRGTSVSTRNLDNRMLCSCPFPRIARTKCIV